MSLWLSEAGISTFPALHRINVKLTIVDKYLGQWFSNLNKHQNHLEDWLKQLASHPCPLPPSFSFSSSGMGPEETAFLMSFPSNMDAAGLGTAL